LPLIDTLGASIADAMRQKDVTRLSTLRMLKAALMNREVERGRGLNDAESQQVVASLVKQRKDSIEQFTKGGRMDLADKEAAEIRVLEAYLPAPADPAIVHRAIADAIQDSMDRARLLQSLVEASPDFELVCPAQFGIVCFRARVGSRSGAELDDLNERINAAVVAEGRFLISSTRLNGRFSLRMCTLGFRTTNEDVRELFRTIERALQQLK